MRLQMRLPEVKPGEDSEPTQCPSEGCEGEYFKVHQQNFRKPLVDSRALLNHSHLMTYLGAHSGNVDMAEVLTA